MCHFLPMTGTYLSLTEDSLPFPCLLQQFGSIDDLHHLLLVSGVYSEISNLSLYIIQPVQLPIIRPLPPVLLDHAPISSNLCSKTPCQRPPVIPKDHHVWSKYHFTVDCVMKVFTYTCWNTLIFMTFSNTIICCIEVS